MAVPLKIDRLLTYRADPCAEVPLPGTRVVVPVGRRMVAGVVWRGCDRVPEGVVVKEIDRVLDAEPLLPGWFMGFVERVAGYYLYPLGLAVKEALPPGLLAAKESGLDLVISGDATKAPDLEALPASPPSSLTSVQEEALGVIIPLIRQRAFSPVVLHGVTGSGKTEVYLRAVAAALEMGRRALVLVPEIALTAQAVGWFQERFGAGVAVLHSRMARGQRLHQWRRIRRGGARVILGTRSAVFAPVEDLGVVVVDEEHDPSYKQEEKLPYNARDLALMLGRQWSCPVVLGSATPSLTSYHRALSGEWRLVSMPQRVEGGGLPEVELVEARERDGDSREPRWLSRPLFQEMEATLGRGEQVLLFVNRRGFAPYVVCQECGHVFSCSRCAVSLTWHRQGEGNDGVLVCHYCGYKRRAMPLCPACSGEAVKALGFGTEQVEQEVAALFPQVEVARLDQDSGRSRRRLESLLKRFRNGEIGVLVGTQMVAKGHDFPMLTLVGVLLIDFTLNFPEYHAAERAFQLLVQVAGRAGRHRSGGKVLIQTHSPGHVALIHAASHDYAGFAEQELEKRKELGYPPFGRLALVRFKGRDAEKVAAAAAEVARFAASAAKHLVASPGGRVEVLGPVPAPIPRIKGMYRWQLLLKSADRPALRGVARAVREYMAGNCVRGVRASVDMDPLTFM